MIYESTILQAKAVNEEKELDAFFETVENRFEDYTIAEASATVISEQEENWNKFMQAVGIDELSSVMEGSQIIYEGGRLEKFKETLVKWFEYAKKKLADITKAFMDQVDKFVAKANSSTVKSLKGVKVPSGFTYKGYEFKNLDQTPKYEFANVALNDPAKIISDKERYNKSRAIKDLVGIETSNLQASVKNKYFGSEMVELKNINLEEQYKYITGAGAMKKAAKQSYNSAKKSLDKIIKEINSLAKKSEKGTDVSTALGILGTYYKTFANGAVTVHSTYMRAIGARSRQALAICVNVAVEAKRAENKQKKASKAAAKDAKKHPENVKQLTSSNEGYVDTSAFLGAVEFI